MLSTGRISGVLLPLFSLRSEKDFGIGDFGSVEGFLGWLREAKQKMWMLLPLLPTAPGDPSPYATRSAFGLNPLFIDLHAVPEFAAAGGADSLSPEEKGQLSLARSAERIRYDLVFPLKNAILRRAFDRFYAGEWAKGTPRAAELKKFREEMSGWIEDFALFAALSDEKGHWAWWDWGQELARREPAALDAARKRLDREILFHAWLQWIADAQWRSVRELARRYQVLLCGDEPFIIAQNSSDAWAHPHLLRRDARLGVPPDAFSATGQDWGLPYFDFQAMETEGYRWLQYRARMAAAYYDLRRVDHAVGYFRQWIRDEKTPTGRFIPPDEASHRALGEKIFRMLSEGAAGVVAEDLGVIPDFVRQILSGLGIPGYKVMRWEKDDAVFRDPHKYAAVSLATTGTHDTDTLREWWESAPEHERAALVRAYPELSGMAPAAEFSPSIHRALLTAAESSGSNLCVLPWQDVYGTRDRVNLPGSMGTSNWSYRIEDKAEDLLRDGETRAAAAVLAQLTEAGRRAG